MLPLKLSKGWGEAPADKQERYMKTLTLKLKEDEMDAIDSMAGKKGLTKTALIKQALRVFQVIDQRLERGEKLFLESDKEDKAELLLL